MRRFLLLLLPLLLAPHAAPAQTGEINFLTDLLSPFPPGCIALDLPVEPASEDNTLFDVFVPAPGVNRNTLDNTVRVTIWRVGCPDEDFSVVMVRLQKVAGPDDQPVLVPQVFAEAGIVELPFHEAQLIGFPAVGNIGATGGVITQSGTTYMLGVDPLAIDGESEFTTDDYNDLFTLELFWGGFTPAAGAEEGELFEVNEYIPELDPPQFDVPVLHGRHSGQWIAQGVPNTGLVLQIAEQFSEQLGDINFVFAIFFTYLDGAPFWVVGNTGPGPAELGAIELDMFLFEGGVFFTDPDQPPSELINREKVGTIVLEPLGCHRIRVTHNFGEIGMAPGEMIFERFIRIAGYDCNPWE